MNVLANNLTALHTNIQLGITNNKQKKINEKLCSGYRVNQAADDAAGLKISEKMRMQIRGLNRGAKNTMDALSWLQVGDGALTEAALMLHRMKELGIQSLNDTNSKEDRQAMQDEFEALQSEMDHLYENTLFNGKHVFYEHEPTYYQMEGAAHWDPNARHIVAEGSNDLEFVCSMAEGEPQQTFSITVPPGEYSTHELIDEIDTALHNAGYSPTIAFEYTKDGTVNANLEGGESIDRVTGGLSYLLYDNYTGGGLGALIGTTIFQQDTDRLRITRDQNDTMTFTIKEFNGTGTQDVTMQLAAGSYTRNELIDLLNEKLARTNTTVRATTYGTGIMLSSEEYIVTGFKGNMFKIELADKGEEVFTSVFYDNTRYGTVEKEPAYLKGGFVLSTDERDSEHEVFVIDHTNNNLKVLANAQDGSVREVTLTIDQGHYTAGQMAAKLNSLFTANGLEATTRVISERQRVGAYNVTFEGLYIESNVEGLPSKLEIDPASSAYRTLFTGKAYNVYGAEAVVNNETTANREAYCQGTLVLSGISATSPLELTSANNTFSLTLKDTNTASATTHTITLAEGSYTSADDIVTEIQNQINTIDYYNDKVQVSLSGGCIRLSGVGGKEMDIISVSESSAAHDTLFHGYSIVNIPRTVSNNGTLTLTPDTANGSSGSMKITAGGIEHTVTFGSSTPSLNEMAAAINAQISAQNITFTTVSGTGQSNDRNFTSNGTGQTTVTSWNGSVVGRTVQRQGVAGQFEVNEPAVLELGPQLKPGMAITDDNKDLVLTINGRTETLSFETGRTYSQSEFKDALQALINDKFGTGWGGASVSLNNNTLVLTANLPVGYYGQDTNISCSTGGSSFLRDLNTTKSAAVCTTDLSLASTFTLDASTNEFKFTYREGGTAQEISLTLAARNYDRNTFITEINRQLARTGTGITASLSGAGQLVLTSSAVGDDVSINYNTATGGSSKAVLYGSDELSAIITLDQSLQNSITIGDSNRDFRITVNGQLQTVQLDTGTYSASAFTAMLNTKLAAIGASASVDRSGRLTLSTINTGAGQSISMTYDNASGSAMEAMFGTNPGINASVSADGSSLVLKAVNTVGGQMSSPISVSSGSSAGLVKPEPRKIWNPVTISGGYHSRKCSKLDGVNLNSTIKIDEWSNKLQFYFTSDGSSYQQVNITLDQGTYTYDTLQEELQRKLNANAVASGKIEASVDAGGVVLKSANYGSRYQFYRSAYSSSMNPTGGFYWTYMCECNRAEVELEPKTEIGRQLVDGVYIIGRKDVRNGTFEIVSGTNDEFAFDLTIDNSVSQIAVRLDQGVYNGTALVNELQSKIDERLVEMGMQPGLVEATIGGVESGVYGSNDVNALCLRLAKDVEAPGEGHYAIDGVTGDAAFEFFYQTTGKLVAAYTMGTKDITDGVTIDEAENLSFIVDGNTYTVELGEGSYSQELLLETINQQFRDNGAPLIANTDDGRLRINYTKMGTHVFGPVSGSARADVFNEEHGEKERDARHIQLSSLVKDSLELPDCMVSTTTLGINSVCITDHKYAEKALGRLDDALFRLNMIRSTIGVTQNRFEHALRNNENAEENVTAAESGIRDADMAEEFVELAKTNILKQATQAILAQGNNQNEAVVKMLMQ